MKTRGHREAWSRRDALALGAGLTVAAPLGGRLFAAEPPDLPNIVFILADDMGFADLGCYGGHYATPRIDALARSGMRLTQAYANSCVCSPTRVALITGRYQQRLRVGLEEPINGQFPEVGLPDHPNLATLLQARGYRTVLIGKWHMGEPPVFSPLARGYDRFFGLTGGGSFYFGRVDAPPQFTLRDGTRPITDHGYLTDVFGTEAVREIDAAARRQTPLFLSLHFTAPHWPWEGPGDGAVSRQKRDMADYDGGSVAKYQEMLASLDHNVGRVLDALDKAGASNTLVVFTSDNGGERFSETWPLVGMKGELLEGGIRVPAIVRWAGRIRPHTVSSQVAMSMDWLPTLMTAAGSRPDPSYPSDGLDLASVLTGGPVQPRVLYWRYKIQGQEAVRDGDWKYLKMAGREYLFNLAQDQRERANLAAREPTLLAQLKEKFRHWNAGMLPYTADSYGYDVRGKAAERY